MIRAELLEEEIVKKFNERFSPYFDIHSEIFSDCGTRRADALITCKKTGATFIVELKHGGSKRGDDIGYHIVQGCTYSLLSFNGKRHPVFIWPAISRVYLGYIQKRRVIDGQEWFMDRHDAGHKHHAFNSLLAHFNCGEIRKIVKAKQQFYSFMFNNVEVYTTQKEYMSDSIIGLRSDNYSTILKVTTAWDKGSRILKTIRP